MVSLNLGPCVESPAQAPAPPPVPFIWAEGGARGVEEELADGSVIPEITGASSEVTNWVSACLSYSTQIQMRTCAPTHTEHPPSPRPSAQPWHVLTLTPQIPEVFTSPSPVWGEGRAGKHQGGQRRGNY